ncbi:MAG: LVIVD repeat-containing protein [Bacteroidota bacterium]
MKRIYSIIISAAILLILQSCSYGDSAFDGVSESGTGGSMARFTIVGDHLFTVDQQNLNVFDIASEENPEFNQKNNVGFGVETIFPLGDKLFLGTSTGMYIYDISTAGTPRQISFYEHVIACDPVVSDGQYAYVTLNASREECWRSVNELQIIDLQNIERPQLLKQYQMQSPRGLAVRNDTLWVCDNGLKVFDISDKLNIAQLYHFNDLVAYDLILDKNRALVIGETGFVQYKLENDTIIKLSEINVEF